MIDLSQFVTDADIEEAKKRILTIRSGFSSVDTYRGRASIEDKRINYDLYNGIVRVEDIITTCNQYIPDISLPAKVRHLDITRSKVNVLIGEQKKRPFRCAVQGISYNILNTKSEQKAKFIKEQLMLDLQKTAAEVGMAEQPKEQPKSLKELSTYTYQDTREKLAAKLRTMERRRLNLDTLTLLGWQHAAIVAEEFYHVTVKNGKPAIRVVNPINIEYDKNQEQTSISHADWVKERRVCMPYAIIDEFKTELTKEQIQRIETYNGYFMSLGYDTPTENGNIQGNFFVSELYNSVVHDGVYEHGLSVTHTEWKQAIVIKSITYTDDNGVEVKEIVPNNFKMPIELKGRATINRLNVVIAWQGTIILNDIVVNVKPIDYQFVDIEDMSNDCTLNYVGGTYSDLNSKATSLVDVLKPIQFFINGLNYKLELELMKSEVGKKLLMDVTQLPRMGDNALTIEEWLHYISNSGIIFINPMQNGEDTGRPSGYTGIKEIDLSLSASIGRYIEMISFLMNTAAQASGISPQREATISKDELVGNVNAAVVQSAHITEIMFTRHEQILKELDEKLLHVAKGAYRENKLFSYIGDDNELAVLEYDADLFNDAKFGIFITTTSRDMLVLDKAVESIDRALQAGIINMSTSIELRKAEDVAGIVAKIRAEEQAAIERQQAKEEADRAAAMQAQEANKTIELEKIALEREKLAISRENNIRDNDTKLKIANLTVNEKSANSLENQKNNVNLQTNNDNTFNATAQELANINKTIAETERLKKSKP
jgi:hypothetical protein